MCCCIHFFFGFGNLVKFSFIFFIYSKRVFQSKSFSFHSQTQQTQKVVLIGRSSVGKTSVIQRFILNTFGGTKMTTGATFYQKQIFLDKDVAVLNVWDTAGEEKFKSVQSLFYRHAKVIIIVFDITDQQSVDDISFWSKQIQATCENGRYKLIIAGNKTDVKQLADGDKEYFLKQTKDIMNAQLVYCSAKTGEGIDELFKLAAQLAVSFKSQKEIEMCQSRVVLVEAAQNPEKKPQESVQSQASAAAVQKDNVQIKTPQSADKQKGCCK